jgi:hypothetical protein
MGLIVHDPPKEYQTKNGKRVEIQGAYSTRFTIAHPCETIRYGEVPGEKGADGAEAAERPGYR